MSYIGNTNTTQGFIPAIDYFSGNGSTVAFTLSRPVASVAQVQANISNVPQNPSSAFSVSGNTITFTSAPPSGTNNIYVYYTSPITQVIAPSQGTVTSESFGTIVNFTTTGNTILGDASTDTLNVGNGGLVKDASGNVGIGVTPSAWDSVYRILQIGGNPIVSGTDQALSMVSNAYYNSGWKYITSSRNAAYYEINKANGGVHAWYNAPSGTAGNAITWTQAMTLDASGNVGIGTSSPGARLAVNGSTGLIVQNNADASNPRISITPVSGGPQTITPYGDGDSNEQQLAFCSGVSGAERMRIDSSGNLLVGATSSLYAGSHTIVNTSNSGPLAMRNANSVAGRYFGIGPDSGNNFIVYNQNGTGVYVTNGGTSWTANSDERVKDIIEPITDAAQKVSTLRAVIGKYKTDEEGVRRSFLIAQDVQAVLPEAVNVKDDEIGTLGVQYTDVIPLLVAAIKEQQAIIATLTDRITALENK